MKATALLVQWHEENAPIFSADFDPSGRGRLATAGGDNNVRMWRIEQHNEERTVTYLSTLTKHARPVNVVRWNPRGDTLASASDDSHVILWSLAENQNQPQAYGEDHSDDVETWRVKKMCGGMLNTEIYDLAWSPDGSYFITGSMDNVARIYNSSTGACIRQIAEHNHYVQGVAWDPLNEYIATQSSDRSVHIYTLKSKDGQFTLDPHNKVTKVDLPARRRISSSSPAPPDLPQQRSISHDAPHNVGSPVPSAPGTPQSLALPMPMNPPPTSHSRRSSFGSSPSIRRSASPAPSLPLPAVMPTNSPRPGMSSGLNYGVGLGVKQANIYASETLPSFFRRLTFAVDGSLLFTPAGQYRLSQHHTQEETINTVYVYSRSGLNKPPIAYLPGHKKASIAVRCSPILYQLRGQSAQTKQITLDTSGGEEIPALPEPALGHRTSVSSSTMDPPPLTSAPSPSPSVAAASPKVPDKAYDSDGTPTSNLPSGPTLAFGLPYRMVYAVATQDAVFIYDTQQQKPLCVVSNLHLATFTDLTWSTDGLTLIMTSSDGFASCLAFTPGELGQPYHGKPVHPSSTSASTSQPQSSHATPIATQNLPSQASTPNITPVNPTPPTPLPRPQQPSIATAFGAIAASTNRERPASPARSMSASSIGSFAVPGSSADTPANPPSSVPLATTATATTGPSGASATLMHSTPAMSNMPSLTAHHSGPLPNYMTPPETPAAMPGTGAGRTHSASSSVSGFGLLKPEASGIIRSTESDVDMTDEAASSKKRDSIESKDDAKPRPEKRRRIEPTLVQPKEGSASASGTATEDEKK